MKDWPISNNKRKQEAMSKRQSQEHGMTTEKARWMLEGSHGMARDAEAAVALLEERAKDGDAEAMWMLGVCCEFGMGTEQDVARAVRLYKGAARKRSTAARVTLDRLKNKNGRGRTQMDLGGDQGKTNKKKQAARIRFFKSRQQRWNKRRKSVEHDDAVSCAVHSDRAEP